MKRKPFFATMFAVIFAGVSVAQTIHDPDAVVTVTDKQIIEWGKTNADKTGVIVLGFEGLGDLDPIEDFYNGGTSDQGFSGVNYGIEFSDNALGIIANSDGGSGTFSNNPSGSTTMSFLTGIPYLNVAAGFDSGFAFYYASSQPLTIYVWDGLNGTGTQLASETFVATVNPYFVWEIGSVAFNGVARSITFDGVANYCGFDDITFGSIEPGGNNDLPPINNDPPPIPVSNWALYISMLLIVVYFVVRLRSRIF